MSGETHATPTHSLRRPGTVVQRWELRDDELKRHVFHFLSLLTLLLLLAVTTLWVRGYGMLDMASRARTRRLEGGGASYSSAQVISNQGRILIDVGWGTAAPDSTVVGTMLDDANTTGGQPRTLFQRIEQTKTSQPIRLEDISNASGWGPVRWWRIAKHNPLAGLTRDGWFVQIHHWLLAVILAIAPALALWQFARRHRRMRVGLCANCGYDLRATPGRCPECGAEGAITSSGPTP
jgi:hypothetical protein